jgi:type IV pilus assembly protein PilM
VIAVPVKKVIKPFRKITSFKYQGKYSPIGLDPGSHQLKLAQLAVENDQLYCHQRIACPTPKSIFEKGMLKNPKSLAAVLRQLRNNINWNSNTVNLCLGPSSFNLTRVKLPAMNKRDLARTMSLEVEMRFSMNPRNTVFSYCSLSNPADKGQPERFREYILVAADRDLITAYVDAVKLAGFKPGIIEVSPLSLLRLPGRFFTGSDAIMSGCTLLIDIGHCDSSFIIFNSNSFCFYRNLRSGASGISGRVNRSARASLNDFAADLLAGVEQSLEYWLEQSENNRLYPETLYLSGGGIYIPGLASALGKRLGLKPRLFKPVASLCSCTENKKRETGMEDTLFAASYGLALRGWIC